LIASLPEEGRVLRSPSPVSISNILKSAH
jgi:hypothetical protein